MPEGIWIALIGAFAAIAVALIENWRRKKEATDDTSSDEDGQGVAILRPKDRGEIVLSAKETSLPISRTVAGKVTGFTKEEIITSSLEVVIDVKTDKWYKQGKAKVQSSGAWSLMDVRLGGLDHIVRATLRDEYQVYGTAEIKVRVPSIE